MPRDLLHKVGHVRPPPDATHWAIHRGDPGGRRGLRYTRLRWPEPEADGSLGELWPVEIFSPKLVLETWGPGKYRVDWYGADGAHMKGLSRTFQVAKPRDDAAPPKRRRARPAAADEPEADEPTLDGVPVGRDGRVGLLEVIALMQQSEQRAADRAEAQRAREREESTRQMQMWTQLMGNMRGSAQPDFDTVGRQISLSIREQMMGIREELGMRRLEEAEEDRETEPEDLQGALDRFGLGMLGELEKEAPGWIRDNVPKFLEWMKTQANGGRRA